MSLLSTCSKNRSVVAPVVRRGTSVMCRSIESWRLCVATPPCNLPERGFAPVTSSFSITAVLPFKIWRRLESALVRSVSASAAPASAALTGKKSCAESKLMLHIISKQSRQKGKGAEVLPDLLAGDCRHLGKTYFTASYIVQYMPNLKPLPLWLQAVSAHWYLCSQPLHAIYTSLPTITGWKVSISDPLNETCFQGIPSCSSALQLLNEIGK